jgi:DNA-binding transcriptional regulator YbjK
MSNTYWEDEEDEDDTTDALDGNDLVKKLRKAKRSDEKRIKELSEQLEGFLKDKKESTVRQVLENKGVNLKAARLIMKDLDDVNEETVNNWLNENADLFGIKASDAPEVDKDNLATLRSQDVITQGAVTPDKAQDLETRLDSASSQEEILSLLRSQQQ